MVLSFALSDRVTNNTFYLLHVAQDQGALHIPVCVGLPGQDCTRRPGCSNERQGTKTETA